MARKTTARSAEPTPFESAMCICTDYWGVSEQNHLGAAARALRNLKLQKEVIRDLRDWLPTHASGTAGDRVRALDDQLARMESE